MFPKSLTNRFNGSRQGGQRSQGSRADSTMSSTDNNYSTADGHTIEDGAGDSSAISSSDYARRCRDLMVLYKDLLDLGAKSIFKLPRVVVIGGQSSGKSSLVEAVSGINVPRDSGTCTRCPMVCTMSSNALSWSCSIEISYEFDKNGQPLSPAERHTTPFGPAVITDKSTVEIWIRRAQAAILSPHRPSSDFADMSEAELKHNARTDLSKILPFSKNAVNINVYDPDVTDLSFVDLPGLIQNADKRLIDIVRTTVENYIQEENTLIVIAMPMSDDIEMIQAIVLAETADPNKERTIGVLTKPDYLSQGATGNREKWKAVLEGRERATMHGYYCVRLPDDDERARKITPLEARGNAERFFSTTQPWSLMPDRSRFGIPNFVSDISALLVDLIEKNLPYLKKAVEDELIRCEMEMGRLPPLTRGEPFTEVILRVNAFYKDVHDSVYGKTKDKRLVHLNKARYLRFKNDILMTTPDFRPYDAPPEEEWYRDRGCNGHLVTTSTEPRWLSDVRNIIKRSIGWELPGEIPFEATEDLIRQYTGLWPPPSKSCYEDVYSRLHGLLHELVDKHFGRFKYLQNYVSTLIYADLDRCSTEARSSLDTLLKLETYPLYTQNFDTYSSEKVTWLRKYNSARHWDPEWFRNRSRQLPTSRPPSVVSARSRSPVIMHSSGDAEERPPPILHKFPKFLSDSDLDATPKTWTIDEELAIIANVQAYFKVAYQRIIDYVPLTIEHTLNQAFANGIEQSLLGTIFQDSAEKKIDIEALLQEDPIIEKKRRDLKEMNVRLHQIKAKLDGFGVMNAR